MYMPPSFFAMVNCGRNKVVPHQRHGKCMVTSLDMDTFSLDCASSNCDTISSIFYCIKGNAYQD